MLVLLVSVPSLIGQGYYGNGNSGIHPANFPTAYSELPAKLSSLVGNSETGVAYFPPDDVYYYENSTNMVVNPLLIDTNVTSPGLPYYLAPSVSSNYFAYWAYTEFYLNKTKDIAQLMNLLGVKYFVTLNGARSVQFPLFNTANATDLMKYQSDVKPLYSSPSYSIFESTLNSYRANTVPSFTLMSGNYVTLSQSVADGVDLPSLTPAFLGDLNSSNFNFYME